MRTMSKWVAALAVTALAGMSLTACDGDDDDPPAHAAAPTSSSAPAAPSIAWGVCPALAEGAKRDPRETCGTVQVPLNYADAGGATIDVAVSKLSTAKPGEKRGDLVVNPGGPGLPGLDTPGDLAPTLPASVLASYDLIGFDPRGVENSTPQSCGLTDPSPSDLFPYPAGDGSITANVALAQSTAAKCAGVESTLKYFTTANTARDLDRIRQALGADKISYWGQSYGTYLGEVYSTLFPAGFDKMILEGNVDPTKVWSAQAATWSKGMADQFPDAAAVAAAQDSTLKLGSTVDEVTKNYLALADRLDRKPAPVPGTQVSLTGAMLRNFTYALLIHKDTVPVLPQVWKAAADIAAGHLTAADGAVVKQAFAETPATPGVPADNQATMFLALMCGDASWSHDVDSYRTAVAADRKAWPLTAGMPADIWPCAFWPQPVEAPVTVTAQGPRNILILQNRRDHATPWEAAAGLRTVLGGRAVLVGVDNTAHYVYNAGSACADQATITFLSNGQLPAADVNCTDVTK